MLRFELLESRDCPAALPFHGAELNADIAAAGFVGEVRYTYADLRPDGHYELVVWGLEGNGPRLRVYDGEPGAAVGAGPNRGGLPPLLHDDFLPGFDPATWTHGLNVTVLATTFDAGDPTYRGSRVVVTPAGDLGGAVATFLAWDVENGGFDTLTRLVLTDPNFRGPVNTSGHDSDGDGDQELFVTAGLGGGPRLEVFDHNGFSIHSVFVGPVEDRSGLYRVVDVGREAVTGRRVLILDRGTEPIPAVYYDDGSPYADPFAGEFGG